MVYFWIILCALAALLVVLLLWLLFAPLVILAETEKADYTLEIKKLMRVRYLAESQSPEFEVCLLPFNWKRNILFASENQPKKTAPKSQKPTKAMAIRRLPIKRLAAIVEHAIFDFVDSFRITQFRWDLDTTDYTLNAQILPVFTVLHYTKRLDCRINFEGRNALKLEIENRLSRLFFIGIKAAYQLVKLKRISNGVEH